MSTNQNIWSRARKMMIVVDFESLDTIKDYREAIKSIGLNINDCIVMAIVKDKKEKSILTEIHSVVYVSPKDIGLLGKLKDDKVNKLLSQHFDIVLVVGEISPRIKKYINKRVTGMFVGINCGNGSYPIELLTEHKEPVQMINFVYKTLQKIV